MTRKGSLGTSLTDPFADEIGFLPRGYVSLESGT